MRRRMREGGRGGGGEAGMTRDGAEGAREIRTDSGSREREIAGGGGMKRKKWICNEREMRSERKSEGR